jgi:hypothetical protein
MSDGRGPERPVLVTGFPRSGTTWLAQALAAGLGAAYNHEPDNEKLHLAALAGKRGLGRFPALADGIAAPLFDRLWLQSYGATPSRTARAADRIYAARVDTEAAQTGRAPLPVRGVATTLLRWRPRPAAPRLVVKSVHIPLCLEHVASLIDASVVVVTRDPRNVLASWVEMEMPDADRRLDERDDVRSLYLKFHRLPLPSRNADSFERAAWQCALFSWAIRDALSRNKDWLPLGHEAMAEAGVAGFETVAEKLGLAWQPEGNTFVRNSGTTGTGYETKRNPSELRDRWRRTLSAAQVATARAVFRSFSL